MHGYLPAIGLDKEPWQRVIWIESPSRQTTTALVSVLSSTLNDWQQFALEGVSGEHAHDDSAPPINAALPPFSAMDRQLPSLDAHRHRV